jgi:hypothetical protein
MSLRPSLIACFGGLLLMFAAVGESAPAKTDAVVQKIEGLNRTAIAAYSTGDSQTARTQLMEALVLGKRNDLDTHPVMARTYLHLGIVYLVGLKDAEKAGRNFALALRIRPTIEPTPALATDEVVVAFEEARAHPPVTSAPPVASADEEASEPAKRVVAPPRKATTTGSRAREDQEAEALESAEAEKDELRKSLAAAKETAAKERQARENLQQQKVDRDDLLAEAKTREARDRETRDQLQRQKEQLQREKQEVDKELATVKLSEKKEREAKEQLHQAKLATEKQLAETKDLAKKEREAKEQLQKEKLATEKQLASTQESEKKEREAKEQLLKQAAEAKDKQAKDKQLAEARDKEQRDRREKERLAREKLAEGPDVPGEIPQKIFCPALDENAQGTDIFVHCAAQPSLKAKSAALYYRTSGSTHYNSLAMERNKKGWFTAMIPANHATTKVLHYYVEVMDAKDNIAARDGKATSPNIMTLRPKPAQMASDAPRSDSSTDALLSAGDGQRKPQPTRAARKERSKTR